MKISGPYAWVQYVPGEPIPRSRPNEGSVQGRKRKKRIEQRKAFILVSLEIISSSGFYSCEGVLFNILVDLFCLDFLIHRLVSSSLDLTIMPSIIVFLWD